MNFKNKIVLFLALLLGSREFLPASAMAKDPIWVEIILDASGSMLLEKNGETKIQAAKKMLTAFIQSLEKDGVRVSLLAFGHRSSKGCKDIQTLLDFYEKDEARLKEIIFDVNPQVNAKTPLAATMKMAHKSLKEKEGVRRLIVLTDGEDTCKGDPCKVAAELKKDLDVKIYLVAFGVPDPKSFKELQCIGDMPEGDKNPPQTAEQLADMLAKIKKEIQGVKQTILVKGPDPDAWAEAKEILQEKEKGKREPREYRFIASQGTNLEPGEYNVLVDYTKPFTFHNVKLKANEIKVLKVEGESQVTSAFTHPAMKISAVHIESGKRYDWAEAEKVKQIPTGRYTVIARTNTGLAYQWPTLTVAPGEKAELPRPPWGILFVKDVESRPLRVYKRSTEEVPTELLADKVDPKKPVEVKDIPIKKLIESREADYIGLSEKEILLEAGTYSIVLNDGTSFDKINVRKGLKTVLPPEP